MSVVIAAWVSSVVLPHPQCLPSLRLFSFPSLCFALFLSMCCLRSSPLSSVCRDSGWIHTTDSGEYRAVSVCVRWAFCHSDGTYATLKKPFQMCSGGTKTPAGIKESRIQISGFSTPTSTKRIFENCLIY